MPKRTARNGKVTVEQLQLLTEDQLGENIRSACRVQGWHFLWVRTLRWSTKGILDLTLIPLTHTGRRRILHRELKGYSKGGRLGKPTPEQVVTIEATNAAGGDAALWCPEDWFSGKIMDELY